MYVARNLIQHSTRHNRLDLGTRPKREKYTRKVLLACLSISVAFLLIEYNPIVSVKKAMRRQACRHIVTDVQTGSKSY